jgi:hypothetical protein
MRGLESDRRKGIQLEKILPWQHQPEALHGIPADHYNNGKQDNDYIRPKQ